MESVLKYISSPAFYLSVAVIIICLAVLKFIKSYLIKKVAYTNKDEQHRNTLAGVAFNILQYLVIILSVVIVLSLNGVNVVSILAGLGIMSAIIGLALQDTLKDIISGINIYSNNFYKVGDVVRYNGELCEVKYFNARITKFRSLIYESTYTVCNSNINSIEKVKGKNVLTFRFEPDNDYKKIIKTFDKIVAKCEPIYGVNTVIHSNPCFDGDDSITIFLNYRCNPRDFYVALGKVNFVALEEITKAHLVLDSDTNIDVVNKKSIFD